jgi:hypothetical protein
MGRRRTGDRPYRQEWRNCACGCGMYFWTAVGSARERQYATRLCAARMGAVRRIARSRPPKIIA